MNITEEEIKRRVRNVKARALRDWNRSVRNDKAWFQRFDQHEVNLLDVRPHLMEHEWCGLVVDDEPLFEFEAVERAIQLQLAV